jgi:hypothetical protein
MSAVLESVWRNRKMRVIIGIARFLGTVGILA